MSTTIIVMIGGGLVLGLTLLGVHFFTGKNKTSSSDWDIGSRELPIYVIVGTQFASGMGGGVLVAHLGNAYTNGLVVLIYGILANLVFVCLIFLAKWIRKSNFVTVPEILASFSDNNKVVKLIAAFMSIVVPFGWLSSQLIAFGKLYSSLTGINYSFLVILIAIISIFFVMPAGLKTVAWTDFIFAVFMITMCILSVLYVFNMGGGIGNIIANVPKNLIKFPETIENLGWYTLLIWVFAVLPGGLTNQLYYQRVCAIDNEKKVNKSLLITAAVSFLSYVWAVTMGISIRSINPSIEGEFATGWFISQLHPVMLAAFAGLIMATLMSTISSAAQSMVVNITRDIYPIIKGHNLEPEKSLRISRILSVVVLVFTTIISLYFPTVLGMLVYTYAFSAASLLCPIFLGYALKDKNIITPIGLMASMIMGVVGCVVFIFVKTPIPYVGLGILFSLVSLFLFSAMTKKTVKN